MRHIALLLSALFAALAPVAIGQRAASSARVASAAHVASAPRPASVRYPASRNFSFGRGAHTSSRSHRSPAFSPYSSLSSLPFPFFDDSFNPADLYSTGYPVASEPPAFILQAAQGLASSMGDVFQPDMSSVSSHDSHSSEPLMIELQNGRYVRVSHPVVGREGLTVNPEPDVRAAGSSTAKSRPQAATAATAKSELASAVLVFRDGHSEEVRDYTIADGMLYIRGDYYMDGYWNKKIELSSLNLPQTQQANLDRNVKFVLPTSPNEVITRP